MTKDRYIAISEEEAKRLRQAAAAFSVAVNEAIQRIFEALGYTYAASGMTTDQAADALATLAARYFATTAAQEARKRKPHPCPDRTPRPAKEAVRPNLDTYKSPARKQNRARSTIRKHGNRRRP